MKGVWGVGLAAACALLVTLAVIAPSASAVIVHEPGGHFLGVAPRKGINPASIAGSIAARSLGSGLSSNGNLTYHSGPVMHSSAPYLIFWAPSGETIPASSQSLLERHFTDVAADSGKATNVYGVDRQFTDGSGFADYRQTFNASSQAIVDAHPYPARDTTNCPDAFPGNESTCITDSQLQAELQRVITANGLPDDGGVSASTFPASAPIYFVVLPSDVNVCSDSRTCVDTVFCAYHSSFTTGGTNRNLLYAAIPFLAAALFPKGCQLDGNSVVQEPNGSLADVAIKYLSHEDNETITDPLGTAWFNGGSGNEDGDNCDASGATNPAGGTSPNAFLPVLGGSASAGTLYDQLISGDRYYVQSEWSNGDAACEMLPSAGTIAPRFTQPAGPNPVGATLTLDPGGSTSTNPYTSATWDLGDGSTPIFKATSSPLAPVSHAYATAGKYTISLTLVDNRGNLARTTQPITIGSPPTSAFTSSPSGPLERTPVTFNGTASSDPDPGVSITSYAWTFGDGSTSTGSSATTTHTYARHGTYSVGLTVTNSLGLTSTSSHQVTVVDELPSVSFQTGVPSPTVGQAVPLDGSSSRDPDGSIISYAWNFGDGSSGNGAVVTHAYSQPGTYTVTLTVIDSDAQLISTTQQLTVINGPIAAFTFLPTTPLEGTAVSFDGTSSSDPEHGSTITSYAWDFGDRSTASGAMASHIYAAHGTYTVKLTVTNSNGVTDTAVQSVTVSDELPIAGFATQTRLPASDQPVRFDGTSSSDSDGSIVSYFWSFGDGSTGAGATPSHTYATYGTYTVTLTVTDSDGQTRSSSQQLAVHSPPTAAFTFSPSAPLERTAVSFDGTSSLDPESGVAITSYAWSFGDGSTGAGATPSHTYVSYGTYAVTLAVTDSAGQTASSTQQLPVHALPTAAFTFSPVGPFEHTAVSFNGTGSFDPESGVSITSYAWDFGDGSTAAAAAPTHTYTTPGTYTVKLTVINSLGASATARQTVIVAAEPPAARFVIRTAVPASGQRVRFDGSSSSDRDGSIVSYRWSFGDGTAAASGVKATHAYRAPGRYRVVLTVTDTSGERAVAFKTVTVALAGSITKLSLRVNRKGVTLVIAVNGAGFLAAGRRHIRLRRAGAATLTIDLTAAQRRALARRQPITIYLPLRFAPRAGRVLKRTVTITVSERRVGERPLAARLRVA